MIDTILAGVKTPVRLYLFAPNAAVDDPRSISHLVSAPDRLRQGRRQSSPLDCTGHSRSILAMFSGRWWWRRKPAGLLSTGHERSSIVLICGLLLSGGLTSFVWAMRRHARDIEMAKNKFETQNLQFDAALNNMVQGLLMYDRAGKLVISNRRFAELFGVPWEKWEIPALGMTVPQTMQLRHDLNKNVTEKIRTQIIAELQRIS